MRSVAWCALRYADLHPGGRADELAIAACHLLAMGLHRAWGPGAPRLQGQEAVRASLCAVLQGQRKFTPSALAMLQVCLPSPLVLSMSACQQAGCPCYYHLGSVSDAGEVWCRRCRTPTGAAGRQQPVRHAPCSWLPACWPCQPGQAQIPAAQCSNRPRLQGLKQLSASSRKMKPLRSVPGPRPAR